MMEVVGERNEMEYSICRDVSSREASMQLSLMVAHTLSLKTYYHDFISVSLPPRHQQIIHSPSPSTTRLSSLS